MKKKKTKKKIVKRVGWVNVNPSEDFDFVYESQRQADRCAKPSRIACVRVTYQFEVK